MRHWQKLALSAVMFCLPFLGQNDVQALCSVDRSCYYYTDGAWTSQCGESGQCVFCTSYNYSEGCTNSPYYFCETFGACGSPHSCNFCTESGCFGYCP
jgi:hypothetical protein